jgi:hypothetical protein
MTPDHRLFLGRTVGLDINKSAVQVTPTSLEVPFEKVVRFLGDDTETDDSTCFRGPRQRAREHSGE